MFPNLKKYPTLSGNQLLKQEERMVLFPASLRRVLDPVSHHLTDTTYLQQFCRGFLLCTNKRQCVTSHPGPVPSVCLLFISFLSYALLSQHCLCGNHSAHVACLRLNIKLSPFFQVQVFPFLSSQSFCLGELRVIRDDLLSS